MTNFDANIPIYVQVMDYIKKEIVSGRLKTGDQVGTVREMALFFGVNPNTIQRSLQELEREGMVKSERTVGRYICVTSEAIQALRQKQGLETTAHYLKEMKSLSFTNDEINSLVNEMKENIK